MESHSDQRNTTRILIIDDDIKFCNLLKVNLQLRGFFLEQEHSGKSGISRVKADEFQAVVLDIMLPEMDGLEVLRQIRKFSTVPVLMLTALGDEADRILGLEAGADDYLPKTFSTRELVARLRAVIRRSQLTSSHTKGDIKALAIHDLYLDPKMREVTKSGEKLDLTTLEFDLLFCLARFAGEPVDRDTLLREIAGRDFNGFDRSIDVHIFSLRRKLNDDSKNPQYLRTIRAAGYMFLPDVTPRPDF